MSAWSCLPRLPSCCLSDALRFVLLSLRSSRFLTAENLFLRSQLAMYQERRIKPRRIDAATRASLAFLSRLFDRCNALVTSCC